MTCFKPRYQEILYRSAVQRGAFHCIGTLPAEVDLLHQGAAEIDQNALVDAFDPDRNSTNRAGILSTPTPTWDLRYGPAFALRSESRA